MKNKLLNFLTSLSFSGRSREDQGNGLQSPTHTKTTVFGILTICMLLCSVQDAFAQPANDDCAAAIALTLDAGNCDGVATNGDNTGADQSGTEVAGACFNNGSNGVWFSFVAPAVGYATVSTDFVGGTLFDSEIALFSGACGTLVEVACSQDEGVVDPGNGSTWLSIIEDAPVVAGDTYYILVSGYNNSEGTFCIAANTGTAPPPPPANDECASAIAATVNAEGECTAVTAGTTAGTVVETAAFTCDTDGGFDVWYSFVAPAADALLVEQLSAFANVEVAVFDACDGVEVAGSCADLANPATVAGLTAGNTYYLVVWNDGFEGGGDFELCLSAFTIPAPPANDECAAAIAVPVNADFDCGMTVTGATITSATASPEDDTVCSGTEDDDVWFSFVATSTEHNIALNNVTGSTTDLYHSVWEGACGAGLTNLLCSDPNTSVLTGLTIGNTYLIRVYTWTATAGQTTVFDVCIGTAPPPPANDLCASAIALPVGTDNACNFTASTNGGATDSGELPAPSCASYAGGDVWYTVTVPSTGNLTVDTGNGGTFTDSGMSIYSGTCGALTEIECDDDDSDDGAFSLIALTGQTPGDVLYVRVWEFGNNAFGSFNICASSDEVGVAVCGGVVDYADGGSCHAAGANEVVLTPVTCSAAPEVVNADGSLTVIGFDYYEDNAATGMFLGTQFESATLGTSACDPYTMGLPDNLTCEPITYTFEIVTTINEFDATNTFVSKVNDPECASEIVSYTVYPLLTAVDVTADAAACGTLQIDLVDAGGNVCDTQTQTCVADGDSFTADFTMGVTDPMGCSTLTATSVACSGCIVTPPTCDADAPEFEVNMGDCDNDDGDGLATPFTYMPAAGSVENTAAPFITEYILTDGPGGNIVTVHPDLLSAETAANALAAADGGTACIAAINHDGDQFMTLSGELTGCIIASLPQTTLEALWNLVIGANGGVAPATSIAQIEALIANGDGGTVDLTALGGPVDCVVSPFCYQISAEVCIANTACVVAPSCAIAADLGTAPAAPAITNSTCMMGGTGGTPVAFTCAAGGFEVTEVLLDPNATGGFNFDTDGDGSADTDDEFVKLCNTSSDILDVSGVILNDPTGGDWFTFPAGTELNPGACVTVVNDWDGGTPPAGIYDANVTSGGILTNGGDIINVIDASGSACAGVTAQNDTDGCVLVIADGSSISCGDAASYEFSNPGTPPSGGGPGVVSGGSIADITCPAGSTAEYSTDGGTTWTASVAYDQTNAITVTARCLCDEDGTTASPASAAVTTVPGICEPPVEECPFIEAPTVTALTICQGDPNGDLAALMASAETCPDGSTAMVTWWDHAVAQTGTGSVPVGAGPVLDATAIIDASVPGMKFLYAQSDCGDCSSVRSQLMIVINPAVSLDLDDIMNPSCNAAVGAPDGSFRVDAQGGTPPFTYTVNGNPITDLTATDVVEGLLEGSYDVVVTDANGCTDMGNVTLVQPTAFTLTTAFTAETCFGDNTATVTVTADNPGGLNLEYAISSQNTWQPTGAFTGLTAGDYTVFVRDANNIACEVNAAVTITGPAQLAAPAVTDYMICVGTAVPAGEGLATDCTATNFYNTAGALISTVSPFDPVATGFVNPNIVGTTCFSAACTDALGCESELVEVCFEVVDNPPAVEVVGAANTCPAGSETFTAVGGQDGSTFVWTVDGAGNIVTSSDGATATITFGATTDGPFTVSVTEALASGCSTTSSTEIIVENVSQLACRSNLNVSLGSNCGADLDASVFIKNAAYGADSYTIVSATDVETGEDVIATGAGYTANHTYNVMVEHICSGTRCWSTMFAEDKIAPTLVCPPTEQYGCTADNKPVWPGDYPTANDNCCDMNDPSFFDYSDSNVIPAGTLIASGFSGVLAPANWALDLDVAGEVNFVDTDSMNLVSSSFAQTFIGQQVTSNYTAGQGLEICFDWVYNDEDGVFEDFFIAINGTVDLASAAAGADSYCATLVEGDVLSIGINSSDDWLPFSTASITNITASNTEELVDNSTCGSEFIYRTWTIVDCNGNVGETCSQIVNITRPLLSDIEFPDDIILECGTIPGSNPAEMQGTDPEDLDGLVSDLEDEDDELDEDYPVLEGEDLDEKTCFFVASHQDQHVPNLCGETVKIIRTWTVTDWCSGDQVTDIQIIKLLDTTAPVILNCGGSVDVPAAAGSCEGYYGIPAVEIFEECANPVTVTANGLNIGDEVYIPEGGLTLMYVATDACGNTSSCDVTLNLVDTYGPVAICDANTTVSLSNFDNGLAVVCYETFDDGSYDNCEDDIVIKVKRMGSDDLFSNCVDFGCDDSGDTVRVRMRVYDIYLDDYAVAQADTTHYIDADQDRRYSECMIQVVVQDKIDPEIICTTRFIECVDSYNDVTSIGVIGSELLCPDAAGNVVNQDILSTSFPSLSTDPNAGIPVYCNNCPGISDSEILGYRPASIFSIEDNCPDGLYLTITDNPQLGCGGTGRVFRSWKLFDATGDQVDNCNQQIRINNTYHWWNPLADGTAGVNDTIFGIDNCIERVIYHDDDLINWPDNTTFDCNSGTSEQDVDALLNIMPDVYDLVEGLDDDCAELYLAVNDHYVYDLPDACYKVVREWKIFDDCKYDPNDPEDGGFWSATREITVIDSTAPTFDDCTDREFDVTAPNCVEVDQVGCTGYADLSVNATDFCGNDAIVYRWYLDANADGLVDQIGDGNDASGIYPIGTHTIRYEAEDGCGNVAVCEFDFKIIDNKAPTPVCIVLTSTVMPSTGALEIWATDFESGSSCDNCTAYDDLEWRINKGTSRTTPPSANSTSVTYDCTSEIISFGAPMDVQIWLLDEAGNWDFCITQIVFTPINANDTDHPCYNGPEMLDITGVVETEDHDMVEMVDIDVSSTSTNPFTTGTNGLFSFFGVPAGGNYVVTPEKDLNPLNGVTTYDLVLISQHILGVQTLDSPYKIIAADANLSGSVTTLDLVKIRSVILNIDQNFAPNTSWRFVDMDFVFPTPTNPFATTFPEVIAYNNLTNDQLATDFIGVKIGDVNGSALPNQLIGAVNRSADGTLNFDTDDIKLIDGNEYTIDFTATDFTELLGYQYSIEFDADVLEFVDINAGELNDLTDTNFGLTMVNEGIITTSWNSATATTMKDDAVLFSMTFNAKGNGLLSEVMSATSKEVKAEAYTTNLDLLDVALAFNTENGTVTSGPAFELLQNTPNPFKVETTIGFNLPEAQSATLQIMDVSGKLLKVIQGDFVRGYNEVKLNKQELQGAGVLYYQLDTANDTATKKMILID